jgi:hypothetical protein
MEGGADPSTKFKSLNELLEFFDKDVSWMTPDMLKNIAEPMEIRKFLRKHGMRAMFTKQ